MFVASGGLSVIGFYAPNTNLDAPTRNLPSVKNKHVDQPAEKHATPYRIHFCLSSTSVVGGNAFSKMCVYAKCFVQCYKAYCVISVDFVVLTKALFTGMHT